MATAPIILVPGFWLGAWAWDEVAALLRADGHDVTALTLPGMESKDADRSSITLQRPRRRDRRRRSRRRTRRWSSRSTARPGSPAMPRATASRSGSRRWSTSTPRRARARSIRAFEGDEKPMVWEEIAGRGEPRRPDRGAARHLPRAGRPGARRPDPRGRTSSRTTPARDIPSDDHRDRLHRRGLPEVRQGAPGAGVPRRPPRAARRHLDRPADQPLADVVAPGRHRPDHRRGRAGASPA